MSSTQRPEYCEYWQYEQYRRPEYCEYWESEQLEYCEYRIIRSIEPRNTWYIDSIRSTEPRNTTRSIHSRNTAGTLNTPVAPHESNLLQRALVGPSVNVFSQKTG